MFKPSQYTRVRLGCRGDQRLIIVRGCPGAGKSTQARKLAAELREVHIEADMYFARDGVYVFDREELMRAHRWCLNTAKVMLMTRGVVIVSNTFTKYREMSDYIDFVVDHGFGVELYTMNSTFQNVHNVPIETLENMRSRFETHESIIEKIHANY